MLHALLTYVTNYYKVIKPKHNYIKNLKKLIKIIKSPQEKINKWLD